MSAPAPVVPAPAGSPTGKDAIDLKDHAINGQESPSYKSASKDEVSSGEERRVAPDQFDPKYTSSKWEIRAYYSYYVGNNGLSLFNYAPTGEVIPEDTRTVLTVL